LSIGIYGAMNEVVLWGGNMQLTINYEKGDGIPDVKLSTVSNKVLILQFSVTVFYRILIFLYKHFYFFI